MGVSADIVDVGAIGFFETVIGLVLVQSETALSTTDVYEHIVVFGSGVLPQAFEPFGSWYGHFECGLIFGPCAQKARQPVGNAGIDSDVFFVGRVLDNCDTYLPVELGHSFLHHPVVGVAEPVAGLALGETSERFKAVHKFYDAWVVLGQIGLVDHSFCFFALPFLLFGVASTP